MPDPIAPRPIAFRNGRFLPLSEVQIALHDAGFVLGVTVTEQLRTFGGRLYRLDEHMARLAHSLEVIGVDPGLSLQQLGVAAREVVEVNRQLLEPADDLGVAMLVTPGPYATMAGDAAPEPTVIVHSYPLPFRLWSGKYSSGQSLAVTEVQQTPAARWPVDIKCRSRMHYYLADRQAAQRETGARALLLDAQGRVTEASTANLVLYSVKEGLLSPKAEQILPGVSLAAVREIAKKLDIPFRERDLYPADLAAADEVWLTSTPYCVMPVTRFNGQAISGGKVGPNFERVLRAWSEEAGVDIAAQAERFAGR